MLFDRYSDEADFRKTFVRPLLTRLNFLAVAELHGSQEFGKDFVFSELTPFGFLRHYAAVVKHEKSIGQSQTVLCQTVLAQVKQAFSVQFRLPDKEDVHRVSAVVVFNSGKISDNARTWIRSEVEGEKYGRNVHIFDGERLFQLDSTSSFRQGEQLLPRIHGMRNDLVLSQVVFAAISEKLPRCHEARGSFTTALTGFLASPFLLDWIDENDVSTFVQIARIIDSIYGRRRNGVKLTKEALDQEIETLKKIIEDAGVLSNRLLAQLERALNAFRLLSSED